ncbi:YjbF family lipoprotein [Aeromonas molluscorum]|uniref:YjbF family lipoprotein n=1 Tax=Aeromonas molluscorum TaxID=271417 RepID=UPI003F1A210C
MLTKRILLLLSMLLFGCADSNVDSYQQLKYLFSADDEIAITPEAIERLPYASAFVTVDDRPTIFVVLAFAEGDRLSWVSSDRGLIVTEHGRITKTLKLDNDLRYFSGTMKDPLSQAVIPNDVQFSYLAEWAQLRHSGRNIHTVFKQLADESLDINGTVLATSLYEEAVQSVKDGQTWQNYYWLDKKTGLVRKSIQQIGPDNSTIEMVFTKPYAP